MSRSTKNLIPFFIPVGSFLLVWLLNPGYLISILLFYLLPALVVGYYSKNAPWGKILTFSTIVSIPFFVIVDYIGTISKLWVVPQGGSILPFRILGILPIEDYFWLLSAVILILCYYYKTIQPTQKEKVSEINMSLLIGGSGGLLIFFSLILFMYPQLLVWRGSYSYLILGSVFFLIPGLLLSLKYRLLRIQMKLVPFFFFTTFLFEMIATHYSYWVFTGIYLFPPFSLGGLGRVPLEELFFVGVAGPIACISFYKVCCKRLQ